MDKRGYTVLQFTSEIWQLSIEHKTQEVTKSHLKSLKTENNLFTGSFSQWYDWVF